MARRPAPRQARRESGGGRWFSAGVIAGLALATFAWFTGVIPPRPVAVAPGAADDEAEIAPPAAGAETQSTPEFDFYNVLPEMEVVIPRQEIRQRAARQERDTANGPYFLQVGSFRRAADAESLKARLALLGIQAALQQVTVNDATWHRVRIGPLTNARETEQMRLRLERAGYEAMVLKGQ